MQTESQDFEQLRYKMGIGLIPKIGPVLTKRLIAYCGSAEGVFRDKRRNLAKIPGIGEKLADHIVNHKGFSKVDAEIDYLRKHAIHPSFYLDADYPERLKPCEDAPIILYIRGPAQLNSKRVISVVGTRSPTDYGRAVTHEVMEHLAARYPDTVIVSGLAYGIDVCAHRAALKNRQVTVGVLGHGLGTIYPSAHQEIARQMAETGALVTEFRHDEKPEAVNFVKRNRIVAGLSDATIVVESGQKGGALITADIANSYHRDVFAFPGRIHDKFSSGCNTLIKTNRAALIENLDDLEFFMGWQKSVPNAEIPQKNLFPELTPEEDMLLASLQQHPPLSIDQLAWQNNLPMSKVSAYMLELEFKGMVRCLPGKVYQMI
jgi:DNA processing protein